MCLRTGAAIMQITIIKKIEDAQLKAEAPEFRVGDTVKVYGKIKEACLPRREHIIIKATAF